MKIIITRDTMNTVNGQIVPSCMEKSSCKWPVVIGIIVGSVIALVAVFCAIRCCCCRRRRKSTNGSDPSHRHTSAQDYQPTVNPPAYESPKLAAYDFHQKPKTKDDALPPIPSEDVPPKKKVSDQEYDQGMELDSLKSVPTQSQPVSTCQPARPVDGLIPLKTSSFKNPFQAPADNRNPFDASSLGENRDYNPISPLSPQRSYSPFSPSNYTRYTTSPFNDPPSRQASPFSSAASMRTVSSVPPPSPYLAYSPSTAVPQTPSLLDEPKSPYRAFSPLLMPHYEYSAPTPPPAVVDPSSEIAPRRISPLNSEPLELGTSYNTRPQSMALEEHPHRRQHSQSTREPPHEPKAPVPHDGSEQQPIDSAPDVTPQRPQERCLEPAASLPHELPTRNSTYGAAALPLSTPASTQHPPEPVQPPTGDSTRTLPAGTPDKNPFRNPRPE